MPSRLPDRAWIPTSRRSTRACRFLASLVRPGFPPPTSRRFSPGTPTGGFSASMARAGSTFSLSTSGSTRGSVIRRSHPHRPPRRLRQPARLELRSKPHNRQVPKSGGPTRPDPESFLRIASRDPKRGNLKVYLGQAAGVGKTYRMLDDAHAMRGRGIDVVVGFAETHGRAETAARIGDLEVIPRKLVPYKGSILEEMDLAGVIARKPEVAVVDELAHTNAPDGKNEKRWQDVEDLLAAGISVMTAVNVQHLEGVQDVVKSATGLEVKERVPDRVIREADAVVNVDLPVPELRDRLKQGKVYPAAQALVALENFFREENLKSLRELALRETAENVDHGLTATSGAFPAIAPPIRVAVALPLDPVAFAPDVDRVPACVHAAGHARPAPYERARRDRIERQRDGHTDRRGDRREGAAGRGQAVVDVLRRLAERELAQGLEVLLAEEILEGDESLRRWIHLALLQAVAELGHGKIHVHDGVRLADDAIGDALLHLQAGCGLHDVLHALEVLHVDGRHHRNARREKVFHVLPPLLVLAAQRVRVRQLVHDRDLGLSREDGLEIHLLEDGALVGHEPSRNDFEVRDARGRLRPAVRFDETHDDVDSPIAHRMRIVEHPVPVSYTHL